VKTIKSKTEEVPGVLIDDVVLKRKLSRQSERQSGSSRNRHISNSPKRLSLSNPLKNLHNLKNPKYRNILLGIFVVLVCVGGLLLLNFKNLNVKVNNTKYVESTKIEAEAKEYLKDKPFFLFSQKDLKEDLMKKNILIEDIYVNKSFLFGLVLDVREFEPVMVIETTEGKSYFLTQSQRILPFDPAVNRELPNFVYENQIETLEDKKEYAYKSVQFMEKLSSLGINGGYRFDLFGNLSILTLDNKTIRFDLKEKYFSVDEQVKILDNALKTVDYKENGLIDVRFNYLLVKKVP
jgi:cell division septal protein FtsQ